MTGRRLPPPTDRSDDAAPPLIALDRALTPLGPGPTPPRQAPTNALRVSEACGADLCELALANGHRVVRIVGKGNQPALIPLHAPREPSTLPLVSAPTGRCSLGRTAAASTGTPLVGSCAGWRDAPGSTSPSHPTPCATPRSPPPSTPAAASATCRTSHGMPTHARPAATTAPEAPSTATPPTSSRPTSPEQPVLDDFCETLRLPGRALGSRDCFFGRRLLSSLAPGTAGPRGCGERR
jgi:hypothetical protein